MTAPKRRRAKWRQPTATGTVDKAGAVAGQVAIGDGNGGIGVQLSYDLTPTGDCEIRVTGLGDVGVTVWVLP